jgi:hypothetical protein
MPLTTLRCLDEVCLRSFLLLEGFKVILFDFMSLWADPLPLGRYIPQTQITNRSELYYNRYSDPSSATPNLPEREGDLRGDYVFSLRRQRGAEQN